jgi:hypothetical protein
MDLTELFEDCTNVDPMDLISAIRDELSTWAMDEDIFQGHVDCADSALMDAHSALRMLDAE